jgi:predicted phage terminase large subunit-like protein
MFDDSERTAKEQRFRALLADKRRRNEEEAEQAREESGLEKERKPLERSLAQHLRLTWQVLKPGAPPFAWSWHYDLLAEYLELFYQRKILYLIVNVPPRTLKTVMLSVAFPTWVWARDPLPSIIGASFEGGLAQTLNGYRRKVIRSAEYQRLFGHRVQISRGMDREEEFGNTRGGEMRATSPGAGITGRGGDFLLMDDILSPKQADSAAISSGVFDWVDETFLQRRNDLTRSPLALIEQRVGEADMTAHLLKSLPKEDVTHVSIPLVAEQRIEYKFPISGKIHVREKGDVLLPSLFTPKVIAGLKLRSRIYQTQYQGKPTAKGGKTFKREWFRYYGPKELGYEMQLPKTFDEVCQSWDCTFKKKEDSDLVAGHVYGRRGPDKFLIDRVAEQMSFSETIKAILAMRGKHPYATRIYIEDKANGSAIIETLQSRIGGIIAVEPMGSKEARADAASADVESGNFYLPCPALAPWVDEVLDFLCAFPGPLNDDDVDAFSQAINKMRESNTGILDFYARQNAKDQDPVRSIFVQAGG